MKIKLPEKTDRFVRKYHLYAFSDVLIFIVIILAFHLLWRLLVGDLMNVPFIFRMASWLSHQVFLASQIVLTWLGVQFTPFDHMTIGGSLRNNVIFLPDVYGYVSVNLSCSGLKQFYQIFFLMILYPGPWRHKLWFIPMSLVIIHLVNIGRIVTMTYITIHDAANWDFWHDNVVRPFFYV
ncbi:MAG: exosortase/archaeosortase family protein, partial [Bacteroidales bacterium]|nr:exosortase/archaeosortase family protein [Bacteroidales bacterium]